MMFDDEDDLPLPDQFLSQLDLIESQAMATLNTEVSNQKSENYNGNGGIAFADVENLKQTIDDYKRQIERLQDHEMSLQGEATMLRQRLDMKQKEADAARMEMFKSIDQLNQNHKRKVDDMEQQVRSLRSQLQFADHELQQTRSARNSLDASIIVPATQQPRQPQSKQGTMSQFFHSGTQSTSKVPPGKDQIKSMAYADMDDTPVIVKVDQPAPSSKALPANETEPQNNNSNNKTSEVDFNRKWFLSDSGLTSSANSQHHVLGICCGNSRTAVITCPVSKQPFLCDLQATSTPKSFIRFLDHVKLIISNNETDPKTVSSDSVMLFEIIAKVLSLYDRSNVSDDVICEDRLLAVISLLEHLCTFFEDAAVLKFVLSLSAIHCASLKLVSAMFIKPPTKTRPDASSVDALAEIKMSSTSSNSRLQAVLRRTFERALPSLLPPSAFEHHGGSNNGNNGQTTKCGATNPTPQSLPENKVFDAVLSALSESAFHFNVIDLRSYLSDCPLLTVSSVFQHWLSGLPLDYQIGSAHRSICFAFVQLVMRAVTLSSGAIDRFLIHPCHCQPVVIGVLAHIGLASLTSKADANLAGQRASSIILEPSNEALNALVLDAILHVLLLIESQQPLKSTHHQPIFHLFLAKLAEFLLRDGKGVATTDDQQKPSGGYNFNNNNNPTLVNIRQLLQVHDVLSG